MEKFEEFLNQNSNVRNAVSGLKSSAILGIKTDQDLYFFQNISGNVNFKKNTSDEPFEVDFLFTTTNPILNQIFENPNLSIGEYGIKICEQIIKKHIKVKMNIGPFKFIQKGYLSILSKGGKDFMSFLTQKGVSLSDLSKIFKSMRG